MLTKIIWGGYAHPIQNESTSHDISYQMKMSYQVCMSGPVCGTHRKRVQQENQDHQILNQEIRKVKTMQDEDEKMNDMIVGVK